MLLNEDNVLSEGERYQKFYKGRLAKIEEKASKLEKDFAVAQKNKDVAKMKTILVRVNSLKVNVDVSDSKASAKAGAVGGAIGATIGSGGNLAAGAAGAVGGGVGGYVGSKLAKKGLQNQGVLKQNKQLVARLTKLSAKMTMEIAKHDTKFKKKVKDLKNESEAFDAHHNEELTINNMNTILEEVVSMIEYEFENTSVLGNFSESNFLVSNEEPKRTSWL